MLVGLDSRQVGHCKLVTRHACGYERRAWSRWACGAAIAARCLKRGMGIAKCRVCNRAVQTRLGLPCLNNFVLIGPWYLVNILSCSLRNEKRSVWIGAANRQSVLKGAMQEVRPIPGLDLQPGNCGPYGVGSAC